MKFYTDEDVRDAIIIASTVHKDDSWGDFPYVTHLSLTAEKVRSEYGNDAKRKIIIAWLHDTLEDHPESIELVEGRFPELVESIRIISRLSEESYDEFITRVIDSDNEAAISVKHADMFVNLSNNPSEGLRKRYARNILKLERTLSNLNL